MLLEESAIQRTEKNIKVLMRNYREKETILHQAESALDCIWQPRMGVIMHIITSYVEKVIKIEWV